eukprot:TRINITY_DN29325_c0_g1_i1.p1 TRINITY_DN29325_c0_g1~~TRINITY_DN29325_c0_g1_i1.p1  ORF type:complete len:517 (-),score=101.91 TRINITY_DN29325_c0_g1_i1:158-1675(-)
MAPHRRDGDWDCRACGTVNFASREVCFKCNADPHGSNRASRRSRKYERDDKREGDKTRDRREGDWNCGACGAHNFARRRDCFSCGAANPDERSGEDAGRHDDDREENGEEDPLRPPEPGSRPRKLCRHFLAGRCNMGDSCRFLHETQQPPLENEEEEHNDHLDEGNLDQPDEIGSSQSRTAREGRRDLAFPPPWSQSEKEKERDRRDGRREQERREGDWDCLECGAMNFANRDICFKCQADPKQREQQESRQEKDRREGDWDCLECGAMNFAHRDTCFKCKANPREGDETDEGLHDTTELEDRLPASSSGASKLSPADSLKALAKLSLDFRKAWVAYCRKQDQEPSDPAKRDTTFIQGFLDLAADLLLVDLGKQDSPPGAQVPEPARAPAGQLQRKRPRAAPSSGPSSAPSSAPSAVPKSAPRALGEPPTKKQAGIKKAVAEQIRSLNASGCLKSELKLAPAAVALAPLDEELAMAVLALLEEQHEEVDDPNEFVREQAEELKSD